GVGGRSWLGFEPRMGGVGRPRITAGRGAWGPAPRATTSSPGQATSGSSAITFSVLSTLNETGCERRRPTCTVTGTSEPASGTAGTVTVIFDSVADTIVACVSPKRTTLAPDPVAECAPFSVTAWPTSPAAGSTPVTCGDAVRSQVARNHRPATAARPPTPIAMSFGSTAGPRRRGGGIDRPRTGTRATGTRPGVEGAG